MGVKGLWQLISPAGHKISLESLESKKLAIDTSVWLQQLLRGIGNSDLDFDEQNFDNNDSQNLLLVGLFRRICKLLFFGIKPVFVFDGETPLVKRVTVNRRRHQRHKAEKKLRQVAHQMLMNRLHSIALERAKALDKKNKERDESALSQVPQQKIEEIEDNDEEMGGGGFLRSDEVENGEDEFSSEAGGFFIEGKEEEPQPQPQQQQRKSNQQKQKQKKEDAANRRQQQDKVVTNDILDNPANYDFSDEELQMLQDTQDSEDASVARALFQQQLSEYDNIDMDVFASLPVNIQEEILGNINEIKEQRRRERLRKLEQQAPSDFSSSQLSQFLEGTKVARTMEQIVQQTAALDRIGGGAEVELAGAIASEPNTHFVLATRKSDTPEKKQSDLPAHVEVEDLTATTETMDLMLQDGESMGDDDDDDEFVPFEYNGNAATDQQQQATNQHNDSFEISFDPRLVPRNEVIDIFPASLFEKPSANDTHNDNDIIDLTNVASLPVSDANLIRNRAPAQAMATTIRDVREKGKQRLAGSMNAEAENDEDMEFITHEAVVVAPVPNSVRKQQQTRDIITISDDTTAERDDSGAPQQRQQPRQQQTRLSSSPIVLDQAIVNTPARGDVEEVAPPQQKGRKEDSQPKAATLSLAQMILQSKAPAAATTATPTAAQQQPQQHEQQAAVLNRKAELMKEFLELSSDSEEENQESKSQPVPLQATLDKPIETETEVEAIEDIEVEDPDTAPLEDEEDIEAIEQVSPIKPPSVQPAAVRNSRASAATITRMQEDVADADIRLESELRRNQKMTTTISNKLLEDTRELLDLFGIPYVQSPYEADSQCGFLNAAGLVDGVVTEDSDVFLFGAQNVYKNIFSGSQGKYTEKYSAKTIANDLGLNRCRLVQIAMLLGSDYTDGVQNVGIVTAMQILAAFARDHEGDDDNLKRGDDFSPHLKGLAKFRDWIFDTSPPEMPEPKCKDEQKIFKYQNRNAKKKFQVPEGFPDVHIYAAYVDPTVDDSMEPFRWGAIDVEGLKQFARERIGWADEYVDKILKPVLDKMEAARNNRQTTLLSFFGNDKVATVRSKKLVDSIRVLTGKSPNKRAIAVQEEEEESQEEEDKEQEEEDSEHDDDDDNNNNNNNNNNAKSKKKSPQQGKKKKKASGSGSGSGSHNNNSNSSSNTDQQGHQQQLQRRKKNLKKLKLIKG